MAGATPAYFPIYPHSQRKHFSTQHLSRALVMSVVPVEPGMQNCSGELSGRPTVGSQGSGQVIQQTGK